MEPVNQPEDTITAEVSYLRYDPKYRHEKLYTTNYDNGGLFPRTNASNETKSITVQNFRNVQSPRNFDEYGFAAVTLRSALTSSQFDDPGKVEEVFYPEVTHMLKQMFPDARNVEILEHLIRKRPSDFPIATGQPYRNLLPTTLVHIDFTTDSANKTSLAAFKAPSTQYRRLLTVNVWKSLQGPGNDWPLALCDRRTINHISETVSQDVVYDDRFSENARVYHSPKHRWYYVENLKDDEVIVFQQTDSSSEDSDRGGVPHTGFFNPKAAQEGAAPRVSIELRAFIYFT